MPGIRRKPVSTDSVSLGLGSGGIRRKPVSGSQDYQQALQHDGDDDEQRDPVSSGYGMSATFMPSQWSDYNMLPHDQEIDFTEIPRAVSPVSVDDVVSLNRTSSGESSLSDLHQDRSHHRGVSDQDASPKRPILADYSSYKADSFRQSGSLRRSMWTPIWLTKTALIAFACVFFLMLIATAVLYAYSQSHAGISVQDESDHYGWKYGPTAVLVIVGALWRQVDHANKTLTPWRELRNGPASVDKTLLLDYISPLLPTSLWFALKNRHWAVAMSICGHLLIVGTTIFSTGLLILEATEVTERRHDFTVKSRFGLGADVDPNLVWMVGPAAAQLYYGIHSQGLQYPKGTSESVIVPQLEVPGISSTSLNYSATTEGVQVDYSCEVVPVKNASQTYMPWISVLAPFWVANITSSDGCAIKGVMLAEGPDHMYYHDPSATENYQGQFETYPCNIEHDFSTYPNSSDRLLQKQLYDIDADHRIVMAVTKLAFTSEEEMSGGSVKKRSGMWLDDLTVTMCKPSYSLGQFHVHSENTLDGSARASLSSATTQKTQVDGFTDTSLALSVEGSSYQWYLASGGVDYALSTQVPTFFQLMEMRYNQGHGGKNSSLKDFMDPDVLIKTGGTVFKGIAAQVLDQLVVQPANETTSGIVSYTENRLKVKALSTGFMCAFLSLLILLSIGMIFARPHAVTPHQPGSAATTTAILAASPLLREVLLHMQTSSSSFVKDRLAKFKFQTILVPGGATGDLQDTGYNAGGGPEADTERRATFDPGLGRYPTTQQSDSSSFAIEPVRQTEGQTFYQAPSENEKITWWRPSASTNWFLSLLIALPLSLIVALEIVQHFSDVNDGFVEVGYTTSLVLATYVPAAVAVGVAAMYSSLELMAAIFSPFDALKRGQAPAERSIRLSLVGKLLPHAAFQSLRTRHFGVAVALLGNFIGGFLTIVVSGLYSAEDVHYRQQVTVHQTDAFDLNSADLSLYDNQATAIDGLIEYLNLTSTPWTYDSLAFNKIEQRDVALKNASVVAPLKVQVPATRAKLNCTAIPQEARQITFVDASQQEGVSTLPGSTNVVSPIAGYIMVGLNTTMRFSDWCEKSPSRNQTQGSWMQYYYVPRDKSAGYIGGASVMQWGGETILGDGVINTDANSGSGFGVNGISIADNGCPTMSVTFGSIRITEPARVPNNTHLGHNSVEDFSFEQDLGTLMCYQNLEEVSTNVTWQDPDFTFAEPPKPDESTAKLLKTKSGRERFPYAVNTWLLGIQDSVYNRTLPGPNNTSPANNDIDEFLKALVNARHGRPVDELVGGSNVDGLFERSNELYQTYMAQAISLNMRAKSSSSGKDKRDADLPTYDGTLTTGGHSRLHQNKGPKIALEVMLACMVACAIGTRLLLRVKDVLPHNPCSIAGTASMLAGSRLATRDFVSPGSEWYGDAELKQMGVFEHAAYSLRWWEPGEKDVAGPGRRYGIDVETEKDGLLEEASA